MKKNQIFQISDIPFEIFQAIVSSKQCTSKAVSWTIAKSFVSTMPKQNCSFNYCTAAEERQRFVKFAAECLTGKNCWQIQNKLHNKKKETRKVIQLSKFVKVVSRRTRIIARQCVERNELTISISSATFVHDRIPPLSYHLNS